MRQKCFLTLFLVFFVNLHEEFQNQIAVICELTLEATDTVDSLCVCFFLNFIFQTFSACLLHPSGIQKCEFPCFRDLFKIAVQEWISQVFCCWCGHCGYFEETWVDVLDYFSNSTSFARSAPALEKYNDWYLVFFDLHLEIIELISGSLQAFFDFLLFRHMRRGPVFKHNSVPLTLASG